MMLKMKLQFYGLLLILPVTPTIIFKENAALYVWADYKQIVRMGVSKDDFTKLEISAKPLMMVEDMKTVDKNRVTVEIKTEEGPWRVIDSQPSVRGGVYTWTSNIAPCSLTR